jgi:hypothetical protein
VASHSTLTPAAVAIGSNLSAPGIVPAIYWRSKLSPSLLRLAKDATDSLPIALAILEDMVSSSILELETELETIFLFFNPVNPLNQLVF